MYVITGATGNTGSVAARHLLDQGQKVRVIGREAKRLQPLVAAGAEAFVADLTDGAALSKAFAGAQAVFLMIPPNPSTTDVLGHRDRVSDAAIEAIKAAGVKHAVLLSSIGADKLDKTGPVVGLRLFEEKLNAMAGLSVLNLRAGYFMENLLAQANAIKAMGVTAGPLRPDLKLPLIATRDIGSYVAESLVNRDFNGKEARELLGHADLTMAEATTIIGKAIGKPDLRYVQAPDDQVRTVLTQTGMSVNVANMILEMAGALNSGHMRALEARTPQNTTPTSLEEFVAKVFVPVYQGA
jgi:uncharacterized protein YbjT (DUF2867 family)